MNAFDSRVLATLVKKVEQLREDALHHIEMGAVPDFAAYQNKVGYLKALRDVLQAADEIVKQLSER